MKAAGINPLVHFVQPGWLEGRNPSAALSVSRYEAAYPSLHDAGVNPCVDYLTGGQAAGRTALPVVPGTAPATKFQITDSRSTRPWTASDGAAGQQGATIHSELGGAGTGVNGSVTFAGISLADALAKFTVTTSTVGGNAYLNIAYTG